MVAIALSVTPTLANFRRNTGIAAWGSGIVFSARSPRATSAPSSVAFAHSAALIARRFSSTRARTAATLIVGAGARDTRSGIGRRRAGATPLSSARLKRFRAPGQWPSAQMSSS